MRTIVELHAAYASGATSPVQVIDELCSVVDSADPAWIVAPDRARLAVQLKELAELEAAAKTKGGRAALPLYGIPFAVKDNIDVRGFPTSAGCPAFSHPVSEDAPVVALLRAAGAIVVGKTALDQFATGLSGTRSPHGDVPNAFLPEYISGGSSSGSASVVARGLVPFALGTDTAGSGRVPAGFNNIVGLKPTPGLFSTRNVVPACRSLDCVSIFALTVDDACLVRDLAAAPDALDPYSRKAPDDFAGRRAGRHGGSSVTIGFPADAQFFGDQKTQDCFEKTKVDMQALGWQLVPIDFSPLHELATLLYQGPWVVERDLAFGDFVRTHPEEVLPVIKTVLEDAVAISAQDAFRAQYRRLDILAGFRDLWETVDALLVPTYPVAWTRAEMHEYPIKRNSALGTYTNFVNLADWCAFSVPAGFRSDGLPFGVTFISGTWNDHVVSSLARDWVTAHPNRLGVSQKAASAGTKLLGATPAAEMACPVGWTRIAIVGAHLSGMPLNGQLTELKARLVRATRTAPFYRLYELANQTPRKPGMLRTRDGGTAIEIEVWELSHAAFGAFVSRIPSPLGIGTIELEDGSTVQGFLAEAWAVEGSADISEYGGWKAYLANSAPR